MVKNINKRIVGYLLLLVSMMTVIVSFAFFTDKKEDRIGVGVASSTPPYIAMEYDLSKGESYVNISREDLSRVKVRVYEGDFESNKEKINNGFKEPDYEFDDLTNQEDLREKLGISKGKVTVISTSFKGTGESGNNKGLVRVPYFDVLGLKTTDLSGMFKGASNYNQDITSWDISNVSNMESMLEDASSFNQDLFNWETSIGVKPVGFNRGASTMPEYKIPREWQNTYKVIFKDRGEVIKEITEGYHNRTLESTSNSDLSLPNEPVREGYRFVRWESSEGIKYSKDMVMPNRDITYEAQWQKKTVEIDKGDGTTEEVDVDENGNITLPTLPDTEGEDFDGWVDEDGNKVEGGTDVDYTEGDKYTPIWKPKEYTVIFKDGSKVLSTQTVKHGENAEAPSNPTKVGHTFKGWKGNYQNIIEDLVITANWELNPIKEKTITLREETSSSQNQTIDIPNLYEVDSISVDKGNVSVTSESGDRVGVRLTGRSYDRREQTGGSYTPEHEKWVTNQSSSWYSSGGYSGNLSQYQAGGSYTPEDSKYVSGQTSSWYNSGGYSGNLSQYTYSGSYTPSHSKTVTEEHIESIYRRRHTWDYSSQFGYYTWFNAGGDSWDIVKAGSSVYYNSGGYKGTLYLDGYSRTTGDYFPPFDGTRVGQVEYSESNRHSYYSGTVTRPSSDTRVYRYRGTVTRPESDTRYYRYQGYVTRPASDTRTYQNYYQYKITVRYREK